VIPGCARQLTASPTSDAIYNPRIEWIALPSGAPCSQCAGVSAQLSGAIAMNWEGVIATLRLNKSRLAS